VSQLDRRQALRLLASLGAAGVAAPAVTACTGTDSYEEGRDLDLPPVKIGVIAPMTGVLKSDGDDLLNGFRLYVKRNNSRLGGRRAEVIYVDEGQSPDSGKAALASLLKHEDLLAISGVVSSAVITAIKDKVESVQIPLVGSNASPSSLAGTKYIWRTSWSANDPGAAMGAYVAQTIQGSVAVMAPDYQAGRDFVEGFKKTFVAAGGRLEPQQEHWTPFVPTPSSDFTSALNKIKASPAKAVYCFYAGTLASSFIKQYRALGVPQTLYAAGFLTEGAPLKAAGPDAAGIWTVMNYSPDLDNSANRRFVGDYSREYNVMPTTFAMAAFDAANVLDRAIKLAGRNATRQGVHAAIGKLGEIDSPRGRWSFGQNRTPFQRWYLRRVRMDGTQLANVVVAELMTLGATA